jgi:Arc/MetJ family transcription regulator
LAPGQRASLCEEKTYSATHSLRVRTILDLDDELFAEARKLARDSGRTLSAAVKDALRKALARYKVIRNDKNARLITDGGNGLRPGVCLDSNAKLLDIMEE